MNKIINENSFLPFEEVKQEEKAPLYKSQAKVGVKKRGRPPKNTTKRTTYYTPWTD